MKLEEIRQRADAATEGPWHYVITTEGAYILDQDSDLISGECEREQDARFIAHARQDILWLISEIDRLNSGIDSVLYDLRNEDITNPHVVEQITENLVAVLNGK